MAIDVEVRGRTVILTPQGPGIQLDNHQEMHEAYAKTLLSEPSNVVLNLFQVGIIDSIGLGTLVSGRLRLGSKCQIHLCGLGGILNKAITQSRLNLVFPVHENLVEALKAIQQDGNHGD